jgi:membrane associated rhomboid family serine protease
MGIYDRDYYQYEQRSPGLHVGGNRMLVTNLVIINAVIFLADILFLNGQLSDRLALQSNLIEKPWRFWELVTYGFAHSSTNVIHILGNMFCLWFFGRDIEPIYGKKRFLGFYLTAIILSGLVGKYGEELLSGNTIVLIGASGGVAAVVVCYICHFPRRTLLIWGVLPMPAWMLGAIFLLYDFLGTFSTDSNVAHTAHLAGALYGFVFYRTRWDLSLLIPDRESFGRLRPRPKIRLHDPGRDEQSLSSEVDRILEKIGRDGEGSLTRKERDTLQYASRRYQRKHR